MATDIPIKVTADTKQAEREIKRLEKALEGIESVAGGAATALAGITAAAAAMGYAILKTLDSAGQLIDVSKVLGISATNLQELQHAASMAGVSAETLSNTLIKLSGNLGSALDKGTGPAIDALNRLGIPLETIARSKPDQQFQLIADKLNAMTNPAERNAMAIELFGKQGPRMLEVARGLEEAKKELKAMGLSLSALDVAALDEAGDAVDSLKSIFDSGLKKAVADISPYIVAIVNKIKDSIVAAGGFEKIWDKVKDAIKTALNIAAFTAVVLVILKIISGFIAVRIAIKEAGVAMGLFNAVVMKNPLMLAVGAALLLANVLGIDVVGAVGDALMPTLDMDKAQGQIAEKAKKTAEEQAAAAEAIKIGREEQEKALKALDETIAKLQINAQLQKDILKYGEDEGNVRKVLNEEAAKLAKVGLTMTEQQKTTLTNLVQEEALTKRILDRRKEVNDAIKGMMDPDESARIEAYTKLQKANEDYIQSLATGNEVAINTARAQVTALDMAYQNQIITTARSKNEMFKLEDDYAKQIKNLDANQRSLLSIGFNEESELFKVLQDQKLLALQEFNLKSAELDEQRANKASEINSRIEAVEMSRIQRTLAAQQGAVAQSLSDQDRSVLQRIGQEEKQRAIVSERIAFEKKSEVEKASFAIDQGAQMFSALGAQNKKAFEAAKAFNIANAIMNTYMAATKALATYPPPFNFIAAAAAVGMGLAQVAQIRSQSYSGRALGGPVMGGQSYIVGESGPELFTPTTTGSITRNGDLEGGKNVNVNFTIVANDTSGFDQLLTSRKGVIQQIISDAMLEKGRRSMM